MQAIENSAIKHFIQRMLKTKKEYANLDNSTSYRD